MLIIPAIDLKDGQCVRLRQGALDGADVYGDPVEMAQRWLAQGARRLHLVDLNGAVSGKPKNLLTIHAIMRAVGGRISVQLGGGIRSLETIEYYLDAGLRYVIIGTAAVKIPGFLHEACNAFPGTVIVGLDAKEGKVAIDGWKKVTQHEVRDLALRFQDYGVEAIIYTDIARDGMLGGINLEATASLARALSVPVIASGGLTRLDDVRALCALEADGIEGVIAGRALYDGTLDLAEAQRLSDSLMPRAARAVEPVAPRDDDAAAEEPNAFR